MFVFKGSKVIGQMNIINFFFFWHNLAFLYLSVILVFLFIKGFLDCRLWQWYAYILKSVPDAVKALFQGNNSVILVFCILPGLLVWQSSTVHSIALRIHKTVDLATLKVLSNRLIGLFCTFSRMMASFSCIDTTLDCILRVLKNSKQMQKHFSSTLGINTRLFNSLNLSWNNKGTGLMWPWNCLSVNLSNYICAYFCA